VQASALTCATCTGVKLRGRPDRGRSSSPGRRYAANRLRHLRTVSTAIASSAAIAMFERRCAAASTIRARTTSRCWPRAARARAVSTACSRVVNMMTNGLDMLMTPLSPRTAPRDPRHAEPSTAASAGRSG